MVRKGAVCLIVGLFLGGFGCATTEEPLWYKPGKEYTTAEFNRDRDTCTKEKKLDHECMKARGWVPVSPDRPAPTPTTPSPGPRRGGY